LSFENGQFNKLKLSDFQLTDYETKQKKAKRSTIDYSPRADRKAASTLNLIDK